MGWTNSDDGKLVPKLMTLAPSLYPKAVPRWLPVAANQDVQQIGSIAEMKLMVMSLQTKDSKWYSSAEQSV